MNLDLVSKQGQLNRRASAAQLNEARSGIGRLPRELEQLWGQTNGFYLDNGLRLYSTEEIFERNETYQIAEFAPGYILIGDDSGGRGILIRQSSEESPVFIAGLGALHPDDMEKIGSTLSNWIESGVPLDD